MVRNWLKRIREGAQRLSIKKRVLAALAILALLTPTILSLLHVYKVNNETASAFSVTLYDANGTVLASESGDPEDTSSKSVLGIFFAIATSNRILTQAPGDPETDPFVLAKCTLNGNSSEWTCYFSLRESDGYCVSSDGTVYAIDPAVNKNFLAGTHAEAFYQSAIPPTLFTIDNDSVLPTSVTWQYQNRTETFIKAEKVSTAAKPLLYDMTGELGLRFDLLPDTCKVSVLDGKTELFSGSYRDLPTLTVEMGSVLEIKVKAEWKRLPAVDYYGTIEYHFFARIRNQSNFFINSDSVTKGTFAVLSCTNVTDLSKIQFLPEAEGIIPTPIFHRDGELARALLVFPEQTEVERFDFSVSYGASQQSFTLTVTPPPTAPQYDFPTRNDPPSSLTEELAKELSLIEETLSDTTELSLYFRGNFLTPLSDGFSLIYSHGAEIVYGDSGNSCTAFGTEFQSSANTGARILALNHGIVLAVGEKEELGRYIVVDHGGGLRTWYCHIGTPTAQVGDVVKKGDLLGRTGKDALSVHNGVLILCTVYNTPIDPSFIIGNEIRFEPITIH